MCIRNSVFFLVRFFYSEKLCTRINSKFVHFSRWNFSNYHYIIIIITITIISNFFSATLKLHVTLILINQIWDHSFSTKAKFPEKLTFLPL